MKFIVCYDIANDRRRTRISAALEGFGERIHESVFECELRPVQLAKLRAAVRRHLCEKEDTLRIYPLCERDRPDIGHLGCSVGRAQREAFVV